MHQQGVRKLDSALVLIHSLFCLCLPFVRKRHLEEINVGKWVEFFSVQWTLIPWLSAPVQLTGYGTCRDSSGALWTALTRRGLMGAWCYVVWMIFWSWNDLSWQRGLKTFRSSPQRERKWKWKARCKVENSTQIDGDQTHPTFIPQVKEQVSRRSPAAHIAGKLGLPWSHVPKIRPLVVNVKRAIFYVCVCCLLIFNCTYKMLTVCQILL